MRSFRFVFLLSGTNQLEELSLTNSGEIENIGFIKLMKNLKVFVFIDTNVVGCVSCISSTSLFTFTSML